MGLFPAIWDNGEIIAVDENIVAFPFVAADTLSLAAEPETVILCDVSRWNGPIAYPIMAGAGARGVVIRAGSRDAGGLYTDWQWENNINNAPMYMDYVGVYWFVRPEYDPVAQAIYFLDLIADHADDIDFLVADCEIAGLASQYKQFCAHLAANSDKPILLYSNKYSWDTKITGDKSWHVAYEKWIASWWTDTPTKPTGWVEYAGHQYEGDGNGKGTQYGAPPPPAGDADMDLNRFFAAWLAQFDEEVPPMPTKFEITKEINVVAREYPAGGKLLEVLEPGEVYEISESTEHNGQIWHRLVEFVGWVSDNAGNAT